MISIGLSGSHSEGTLMFDTVRYFVTGDNIQWSTLYF